MFKKKYSRHHNRKYNLHTALYHSPLPILHIKAPEFTEEESKDIMRSWKESIEKDGKKYPIEIQEMKLNSVSLLPDGMYGVSGKIIQALDQEQIDKMNMDEWERKELPEETVERWKKDGIVEESNEELTFSTKWPEENI